MATFRTSAAGGASSGTGDRTAVLTPVVGDLWVVFCYVAANTNDTPTCSDNNGGSYTRIDVANCVTSAINYRLSAFVRTALHTNTTSTTVTVATGSNTSGAVVIVAISGMTRSGINAIRSNGRQDNQAAGTAAPVLNQTSLTTNLTLVAHGSGDTTTTPPGSWTEAQDTSQVSDPASLEVAYRDSGFAGTTITFGAAASTTFCSMAIEIDSSLHQVPAETINNWADTRGLGYGLIFADNASNLADAFAKDVGVLLTFEDTISIYPEAYWRMESVSGGIVTECRQGFDLTVIGAPTAGAGKIGNAITFDGSADGLSSGTSVSGLSTNGGSWTYWGWFKRSVAATDYLLTLRNDSAVSNSEVWISWLTNNSIDVNVGSTDNSLASPTMASDGAWHLLVVTFNSATGNVEVSVDNGTPGVYTGYPNPTTGANTQLFVAQSITGTARLAGSIDGLGFGRFYAPAAFRDVIWNAGNGLDFCLKDSLAKTLADNITPLTQSASDDLNAWGDDMTGDRRPHSKDSFVLDLQAAGGGGLTLNLSDTLNNWADALRLGYGLICSDDANALLDDLSGDLHNRWQDSLAKTLSSAGGITLTASDSFTLTDGSATTSVLSYDVIVWNGQDLNNWQDALTKTLATSGALTLNLSDTLNNWNDSIRIGYGHKYAETINAWAEALRIGYGLLVSDSFTLTDSIVVRSSALTLNLSDSFTLTDSLTRIGYGLKVADQVVLTDAFQKSVISGGFAVWQNIAAVTLNAANLAAVTLSVQNLGSIGPVMYRDTDTVTLLTNDTDTTSVNYADTDSTTIKYEDTDVV